MTSIFQLLVLYRHQLLSLLLHLYFYLSITYTKLMMHGYDWHTQSVSGIQTAQILEPICGFASPKPQESLIGYRRSLNQHPHQEILDPEPFPPPFIGCRVCNMPVFYS